MLRLYSVWIQVRSLKVGKLRVYWKNPCSIELGESPEQLEDRAIRARESRSTYEVDDSDIPDPTEVIFEDYDNPFDLVEDASGARHVATMSRNSWVGCGDGIYVLECLGKGYIRIELVTNNEGNARLLTLSRN